LLLGRIKYKIKLGLKLLRKVRILMKNFSRGIILVALLLVFISSVSFATEKEYVITKTVEYVNERSSKIKEGFVEIELGQVDITKYSKDEYLRVSPKPDRINEDEFGNLYAYYNAAGMLPKQKLTITIERKATVSTYVTDAPVLARSNGSVTEENKRYVQPQTRIESDNQAIINKANELTEGLTTDYRKASAIFEYVNTTLTYDTSSTYANKGALSALNTSRGVCEEFATLFVALCRAEEIPARVVAGYKVEKVNNKDTLIDHAWAEIYLDDYGWLPVETTVVYSVNGQRMPYWNTFCSLNEPNHIATELYYIGDKGNRQYQNVTETPDSFKQILYMEDEIVIPARNTFTDISNYSWASDSIQTLFELGIVKGYSDTEYGPARNISRIEFMTMLSRSLKYLKQDYVANARIYYYPSYSRNHWSKPEYDYLMQCYQFATPSDIMSAGYENLSNVFGDGANLEVAITRGEAVALMDAFLKDVTTYNTFSDVPKYSKFANSIAKAYSAGIIDGYPDGTFKPSSTITRAEMACVLGRYVAGSTYHVK